MKPDDHQKDEKRTGDNQPGSGSVQKNCGKNGGGDRDENDNETQYRNAATGIL